MGSKMEKKFALKPSSHYHFQLQLHMFVSELTFNFLVVWTTKGIFTVEVPYNPSFMFDSCAKLEKVWKSQVLPFTMAEITRTVFPGGVLVSRYPLFTTDHQLFSAVQLLFCGRTNSTPQVTGSEADTSTFQDISSSKQSAVDEVIDHSTLIPQLPCV